MSPPSVPSDDFLYVKPVVATLWHGLIVYPGADINLCLSDPAMNICHNNPPLLVKKGITLYFTMKCLRVDLPFEFTACEDTRILGSLLPPSDP
jgi:hypothetical protein